MTTEEIRERLYALQDKEYAQFQAKLIPSILGESIIGVRTPELRKLAKEIYKENDYEEFIKELPHKYFEENQLHSFVISLEKDYNRCVAMVDAFLPFVDNWATCDQLSPKVFKKHKEELLAHVDIWLASEEPYTIRFGVGMLMEHFLDEDFAIEQLEKVIKVQSPWSSLSEEKRPKIPSGSDYYIHMMVAWYMATALAKQWDATIAVIEDKRLDRWTHNKAIQKAIESYRITPEQKQLLRTYKIK